MNPTVSAMVCQARTLSREDLAVMAARLAYALQVSRDMNAGHGLQNEAREVAAAALQNHTHGLFAS